MYKENHNNLPLSINLVRRPDPSCASISLSGVPVDLSLIEVENTYLKDQVAALEKMIVEGRETAKLKKQQQEEDLHIKVDKVEMTKVISSSKSQAEIIELR